jgi:S-adenosylmethionine synthetase
LNVDVPAHLAALSKELGFTLIFISTGKPPVTFSCLSGSFVSAELSSGLSIDYVFDGTSPPYVPSAEPNPINLYGITKRDAELAVLGVEGAHVAVLRVPILCVSTVSPHS